jgi:CheY-like chemotaxis protein
MKHDLECLRLASDLAQLSREAFVPELRAHCDRMATYWSDQVNGGVDGGVANDNEPDGPATGAPAAVLIVDDEPLLRELAATVVEEAGFTVLQAGDAAEALSMLEARSDIALLFTDIDMPGSMNGLKLAKVARDRWPRIRTLVVSGKLRPPSSELPPNAAFMTKPYRAAALVAQLKSMIAPL